ncbi:hypothetical protein B0A49_09325 [Cryomyces minteri]|uniref:Deubiquitination-protection protein dph1 n=1 Tax=Cryomyces minteri TaxID=331657 RepID=A0A4U0WLJ4_9PEZI|nr:hypothetical protein B0A49_09325 [Cryomyces minteri]
MADDAPSSAVAEETHITFNIKSSNDAKYVITLPLSTTVADLKIKLATPEYADLPPARQRLIYSGRVLKDAETLASYKIKDGHTVHLVKGAESNQRQVPANQGTGATAGAATSPAANVPTNIAAGTGNNNPLAALTGARYAGFHQLPGADMFGADGGMGAPPDPDHMLRMLDNPHFLSQFNEAMNNPAVIQMIRQNPMMRDNPMMMQMLDNPDFRRMMTDPQMLRMQLQMQRAMGGAGGGNAFPAPGVTDTTPEGQARGTGQTNPTGNAQQPPANSFATLGNPAARAGMAGAGNLLAGNPFAVLFNGNAGAGLGTTPAVTPPANASAGQTTQPTPAAQEEQNQTNPFANIFGATAGRAPDGGTGNSFGEMMQRLMADPEALRNVAGMMGGMGGDAAPGGAQGLPWMGQTAPADNRPPEERYAEQLRQLNDMGFYDFERNVQALRRSGGSVQGAIEHLLSGL